MEDLSINNVTVSNTTSFNKNGGVEMVKRVSFWAGKHGPFIRDFPPGPTQTDDIKQWQQEELNQLRILSS